MILEESDTVELLILSLELVISIDTPLKQKKKRRYEHVLKKAMFCVVNAPSPSPRGLNQVYKKTRNVLIIVC